ncbi:carboxymuconolactone decarboxylase family protein [Pseudomonas sp. NPDC087598]|uniref:carboxymuconolactone decarboxylase family protein n=1 Tax=unclassified Pseudomonas TaxID=196821 RepID=UPI00191206B0|nr:carboxymuconolactone decarboxylase family protein [Pseudomonas sp. TH06]MBK5528579.1 carboxymuconolactone decarboxylase family protein [Pseudomonas sp. TH06]
MKHNPLSTPMATLYAEGRHTFIELVPDGGARLDALFHTVPALGELAVGVVYGHLHARPGLDPRLREAVSFAAIVASGMVGPPLSVHLKTGLASGLAPGEMTEVLLQASAFAGFPRAVSAAEQLNRLFDEAGLTSPPAPTPRELALAFCEQVRDGHAPIPVSAAVKRQLKHARSLSLLASSAHSVIVECFEEQPDPQALLRLKVEGDRVTSVTLFKAH